MQSPSSEQLIKNPILKRNRRAAKNAEKAQSISNFLCVYSAFTVALRFFRNRIYCKILTHLVHWQTFSKNFSDFLCPDPEIRISLLRCQVRSLFRTLDLPCCKGSQNWHLLRRTSCRTSREYGDRIVLTSVAVFTARYAINISPTLSHGATRCLRFADEN